MLADAGELRSVDSATAPIIEDIDSIFILKEEQRTTIKAIGDRKYFLRRPSYRIQHMSLTLLL